MCKLCQFTAHATRVCPCAPCVCARAPTVSKSANADMYIAARAPRDQLIGAARGLGAAAGGRRQGGGAAGVAGAAGAAQLDRDRRAGARAPGGGGRGGGSRDSAGRAVLLPPPPLSLIATFSIFLAPVPPVALRSSPPPLPLLLAALSPSSSQQLVPLRASLSLVPCSNLFLLPGAGPPPEAAQRRGASKERDTVAVETALLPPLRGPPAARARPGRHP